VSATQKLSGLELSWFYKANIGHPTGFYPFKDRMLKRFGVMVGYDTQELEKFCWTCEGSGWFLEREKCDSCGGTGIYRTTTVYLQRWELSGDVYHVPVHFFGDIPEEFRRRGPVQEFEGLIRKLPSNEERAAAVRSFRRLLIRFEPLTFLSLMKDSWVAGLLSFRAGLAWKLFRLRERMELFKIDTKDEVPF
jgi:hypothetical protein